MTALAPWLAALLVKPALVIAATAVIAALLRRRSATTRHAIWTGAVLALLALPALGLLLPAIRVPLLDAPFRVPAAPTIAGPATGTGTAGLERSGLMPQLEAVPLTAGDLPSLADQVTAGLLALWLAGALLLAARRVSGEVRSRRLLRRARPCTSARVRRLFAGECQALGQRRPPALLVSDEIAAPAASGLLRPAVLLPAASTSWDDADLSAALAHELGHVRRSDCLLGLTADLATLVYWCNPAVWLAVRRMRCESERACDDLALCRGADPDEYARLLLDVARQASRSGPLPAGVTAMAAPHQLESRLLAVLDDRTARLRPPRWVPVALVGLSLLAALPAAALSLEQQARSAEPRGPEPDRLADSLAAPESERLPGTPGGFAPPPGALAALAGPDSALVARLIGALDRIPKGKEDLVRERAAWALGQARGGVLVEPLLEALAAPDWRVRAYAAWALGPARDPRAVAPLIELLNHPVWRLRAMAASALRISADPRALPALTAALTDPAWQVRVEAVGYLTALGGPEMAELLRARRNDRHVAVRLAARRATSSSTP
jgi:beta-lactamase regulating signal transducer with metallopeptidase domain